MGLCRLSRYVSVVSINLVPNWYVRVWYQWLYQHRGTLDRAWKKSQARGYGIFDDNLSLIHI